MRRCLRGRDSFLRLYDIRRHQSGILSNLGVIRLHLPTLAEVRVATEPLTKTWATMLLLAHAVTNRIGLLQTKFNLGSTTCNCRGWIMTDTGRPNKGIIGQTLIGRPASDLASQLVRAQVAALGVIATSLICET